MTVQSVTWVAKRVDAAAVDDARAWARALGLSLVLDEPEKVVLSTSRGDVIEYLTGDAARPEYLFDGQETVVGFLVDDLDAACAALAAAGFDAIGEPGGDGDARFCHTRGPGGVVYGLIQKG
jgi:hypothetical protein